MKKIVKTLAFIAILIFTLSGFFSFDKTKASPKESFPFQGDFAKDKLMVTFKNPQEAKSDLQSLNVENKSIARSKAYEIKVPVNKSLEDFYQEIKQDPAVSYVGPSYNIKLADVPNDTYYASQWNLATISASSAWDKSHGSSSVKIGIIDTGVNLSHADLSSKIWNNPGETGTTQLGDVCWTGTPADKSTNNCDDDQNGYIDDWHGWDFYSNDNNPSDGNGHGTSVAGIAAASTNNGAGIAGVDWNAKIVPLKVFSNGGVGSWSALLDAIDYAADNNIDVINMSLGTWATSAPQDLQTVVDYAYSQGVVMAAAAGNGDIDWNDDGQLETDILYPAKFSNVLAVGATNSSDQRITRAVYGWESNYGPELDVMAPGVSLYSTSVGGGYTSGFGGTSGATPHVAGELALIKAVAPAKTNAELMDTVRNTADKVAGMGGQDFTNYYGYGRINLNKALTVYSWQFISQSSDKNLAGLSPGETANIALTAKNVGTATWYRVGANPTRVGTSHPQDRSSAFNDGTWLGSNRPVGIPVGTDSVAPGAQVTFTWNYKAPSTSGIYIEHFSLLVEGIAWMNDPGVNYYTIVGGNYSWQFISQGSNKNLVGLSPGESATITLTAKNTGTATWLRTGSYPTRVGTSHPQDRSSAFNDGTWLASNRPVGIPDGTDTVAPGEQVTFSWNYRAPASAGIYTEHFSLLAEGITWMNDPGVNYYTVVNGSYSWQFISQTSDKSLIGLSPGETAVITLTAKNTGNTTWLRTGSYPVRVGASHPQDRMSAFNDGTWLGSNRPVGIPVGTDSVAPGAQVTFTWNYKAPSTSGIYIEHFSLLVEGIAWMNDPGVNYYTIVGGGETLEGIPMPAYSGKTAWEQHLSLTGSQEPSATHYSVSGTPILAQNGMAWQTSGGDGYGAWGTPPPVSDERYYIAMRWNYTNLHGQPIYAPKNWYYKKRVLVINPANNKKVIASIIEYGPAPWTDRVSGLSPEAALAIDAVTDNTLSYYWALDQNLPLGPLQ